jgi:hypothetical protein
MRASSLYSGVSGTLFAPDARALPGDRLEGAAGAEFHLDPASGLSSGLATVHSGVRMGLPSTRAASELDLSLASRLWQGSPDADSYSIAAAWKRTLGDAPSAGAAAAVYVKASFARYFDEDPNSSVVPPWDGDTRYAGLSIGLPLEWAAAPIRAFASPEIEVSSYYPNWDSAGSGEPPGLFAWAYLRLGLEARSGNFTIALSGALRSEPFGGGIALAGPIPLGLECRWYSPSSPLSLALLVTGEIEDIANYYFGAGLGLEYELGEPPLAP